MNEITIVVNSCDAYEDVWEPFFIKLRENWPDLEYPILLNTESKSYKHFGLSINTLTLDKEIISWGERLLNHLKSIDSDYVLMLFDDYLLEGPIDTKKIVTCKEWLDSDHEIAAFYLKSRSDSKMQNDNLYPSFSRAFPRSDYLVSSAPALWNKKHLESFIGKNDTPWAWEYFGSSRAYRKNVSFYAITNKEDEIYKYQSHCGGAIHRGKWIKEVIDPVIKKYSLNLDCSKRGYDEHIYERRSLLWYLDFYYTGWKMVKWDIFIFIERAFSKRFKRLFLTKKN